MALHRLIAPLSRLALQVFYRFETAGDRVPETGPLVLVANHPNSLLDPLAVCAVAQRPIRFLARAPLFDERGLGRLVRAYGAIPVYRREDDPALMERNVDTFVAAHAALADGDAVGVFPEGLSHSEPSLAPLRTGAARIALGGSARLGRPFPIVPVGLVMRDKERFRSHALAVVGRPVEWDDLWAGGVEDQEGVRRLTGRIEMALREVTLNLERWEDAPVVECAEAIYASEYDLPSEPAQRVHRLRQVSEGLTRLRRSHPDRVEPLYRSVRRFARTLAALGIAPDELKTADPPPGIGKLWLLRQALFLLLIGPLALLGHLLFFIPYRLTALLPYRVGALKDVRSTYKLLGGAVIYGLWVTFLTGLVAWRLGVAPAIDLALLMLVSGLVTIAVADRWEDVRNEWRAHLAFRRHGDHLARLLNRRRFLAVRLEQLRRATDRENAPRSGAEEPERQSA